MKSKDMKIMQVEFDYVGGDPGKSKVGNRDWSLSIELATFSHRGECKFVFYVGSDVAIKRWKDEGFSQNFIDTAKKAKKSGYKYVCLCGNDFSRDRR